MPNICWFEMRISGNSENCEELINVLSGTHPHWKMGEVTVMGSNKIGFDEYGDIYDVFGSCAPNVVKAMTEEGDYCKYPNRNSTSLVVECGRLNTSIDVLSVGFDEANGKGFAEHLYYFDGELDLYQHRENLDLPAMTSAPESIQYMLSANGLGSLFEFVIE